MSPWHELKDHPNQRCHAPEFIEPADQSTCRAARRGAPHRRQ